MNNNKKKPEQKRCTPVGKFVSGVWFRNFETTLLAK